MLIRVVVAPALRLWRVRTSTISAVDHLIAELPGPLMRQLVQRHLDGASLLALLRTSDSLAQAVVRQRALTLTWAARWDAHSGRGIMDEAQEAAAASLLERWAPAELRAVLFSSFHAREGPAFSLPPAVLPLLTRLHLLQLHLTPATVDNLQQCQCLHTLDVERCSTHRGPEPSSTLRALPLLRTFR